MPISYWITNEKGIELTNEKSFLENNYELVAKKYEVFKRTYPAIENLPLTESGFYQYLKKQKWRQFFK